MMDLINFNYLAFGIIIGYAINPLLALMSKIMINVLFDDRPSGCTHNCNQGRNCTCKESK